MDVEVLPWQGFYFTFIHRKKISLIFKDKKINAKLHINAI